MNKYLQILLGFTLAGASVYYWSTGLHNAYVIILSLVEP